MKPDHAGWLSGVRRVPSPNCDRRPPGMVVDMLVIHCISLPPGVYGGPEIEQLFTNTLDIKAHSYFVQLQGLRVSAHFLIRRDGGIVQFVPCGWRAWHAGVSEWQGRSRCNDFSIGIELEGLDDQPYTDGQYRSLRYLTRRLRRCYPIRHIVGHQHIAPGRKTDPGNGFDWPRFLSGL